MTKPTKWVCALRRLKSAWASARLIRVSAIRMKKPSVLSYPLSAQRRLWSDWADDQADLSLRSAHTYFFGFVMSRLILNFRPTDQKTVAKIINKFNLKKATGFDQISVVDNIPAELTQARGETMIDILTSVCNKLSKTGKWPTTWTQYRVITLPKKGNLQLCQNYRTISLISHPSKVMLKVILNRLQLHAEEIIAEEQTII